LIGTKARLAAELEKSAQRKKKHRGGPKFRSSAESTPLFDEEPQAPKSLSEAAASMVDQDVKTSPVEDSYTPVSSTE